MKQTVEEFQAEVEDRIETLKLEIRFHENKLTRLYYEKLVLIYGEVLGREAAKYGDVPLLAFRKLYLQRVETVEPEIKAAEKALRERQAELLYVTPPQNFLTRFGWELYMPYKEKYPMINGDTAVQESPFRHPEIAYHVIEPQYVLGVAEFAADTQPWPASVPFRTERAAFELWGIRATNFYVRLAWAKEINTIYWFQ